MKTLYAACLSRLGLSQPEASALHKAPLDTVKSWAKGRRTVPLGAWSELRAYEAAIVDRSEAMREAWETNDASELAAVARHNPVDLMAAADFVLSLDIVGDVAVEAARSISTGEKAMGSGPLPNELETVERYVARMTAEQDDLRDGYSIGDALDAAMDDAGERPLGFAAEPRYVTTYTTGSGGWERGSSPKPSHQDQRPHYWEVVTRAPHDLGGALCFLDESVAAEVAMRLNEALAALTDDQWAEADARAAARRAEFVARMRAMGHADYG